jgi:hypothetical protein
MSETEAFPHINASGTTDSALRSASPEPDENPSDTISTTRYGLQFWLIFASLALSALLSALEGSVLATALPTIAAELKVGENYIWIINIYFLTWYVSALVTHFVELTLIVKVLPLSPSIPSLPICSAEDGS